MRNKENEAQKIIERPAPERPQPNVTWSNVSGTWTNVSEEKVATIILLISVSFFIGGSIMLGAALLARNCGG
jgi:hypothetical protein